MYVGSLLVPEGPAVVEIHLPWNPRWRTAPNFQSLNGYNSGVHWLISLKFSIEFQHVTANTLFQGQRVKGQGHSVRNRQHRLTAKSVGLSYLFNLSGGCGHEHVDCQAEVHKTSENTIFSNQRNPKNTENHHNTPERLVRCHSDFEMQCFRNCTLSSC